MPPLWVDILARKYPREQFDRIPLLPSRSNDNIHPHWHTIPWRPPIVVRAFDRKLCVMPVPFYLLGCRPQSSRRTAEDWPGRPYQIVPYRSVRRRHASFRRHSMLSRRSWARDYPCAPNSLDHQRGTRCIRLCCLRALHRFRWGARRLHRGGLTFVTIFFERTGERRENIERIINSMSGKVVNKNYDGGDAAGRHRNMNLTAEVVEDALSDMLRQKMVSLGYAL